MTNQDQLRNHVIARLEQADERLLKIVDAVINAYADSEANVDKTLYRLVYTSARSSRCTDEDIQQILEASRKNNAQLGVTGILIHTEDRFLQVLEGEKDKITTLYNKIAKDDRHGGSIMRYCQPAQERHFKDWEMAGKQIDEKALTFNTDVNEQKLELYKSMMDGDLSSYKDEGMRVLKMFLLIS